MNQSTLTFLVVLLIVLTAAGTVHAKPKKGRVTRLGSNRSNMIGLGQSRRNVRRLGQPFSRYQPLGGQHSDLVERTQARIRQLKDRMQAAKESASLPANPSAAPTRKHLQGVPADPVRRLGQSYAHKAPLGGTESDMLSRTKKRIRELRLKMIRLKEKDAMKEKINSTPEHLPLL